jgi:uncharacterized paraquat-inducible protein A
MKRISNLLIFIRIKTFLKSLFFHVYSGFPKSSQQEIDRRWFICITCDQFDKINSQCSVCGCNLSRKKQFLNKLAWADQKCPIDKW